MENSKLWNTRKKNAWLEILAISCPLQRIIIRIVLIHKLGTKHSNFDIHMSLGYIMFQLEYIPWAVLVRSGKDVVGFKILIMGFSANW